MGALVGAPSFKAQFYLATHQSCKEKGKLIAMSKTYQYGIVPKTMDCKSAFWGSREGAPAIYPLAVLIPAIINVVEAIVNLSIGEAYEDNCNISVVLWYLGVAGGVSMFIGLVKLVGIFSPCIPNDKVTIPLACFFDLSYYLLIIWGSIRVFSKSSF